ncbi:ComEA family DNA-binding protein [Saccharopolyspora rectivirgula]|jgi:competence protein ComEA|uniref:ComEA family DNA-binding protein n=1 Tax=Saccharopolyspora rectivirgula TaxID=28042 RepID=UPI00068E249F|nr:ComEA family DNA-binding protein [Saccharopolyspora rectivirgula]
MSITRNFRARDTGADSTPQQRLAALGRAAANDEAEERTSPGYSAPTPEQEDESALRRFASRWLPRSLVGARVDPGWAGVLVFVVLAAALVAGVVVSVWGARPRVEDAPPQLTPPAAAPTSSPPQELVVSVVGRVARPGLVTLAPGDRVADAVRAAGGPLPDTDLTPLNLARRLTDGEQIHVGIPAPPQSPEGGGTGKLNVNTATAEQLEQLPGIGEVTAERILQWRAEHGAFSNVDQLLEVEGIGEAKLDRLRDEIEV